MRYGDDKSIDVGSTKLKRRQETIYMSLGDEKHLIEEIEMIFDKQVEGIGKIIRTRRNSADGVSSTIVNPGIMQHQPNEEETIGSPDKEENADISDEHDKD